MVLLPLDCTEGAVSGKDAGLIGKRKELAAYAANNIPMVAPGKIGAAYAFEEEGVAGKEYEIAGRVEAHAAGGVTRGVEDGYVGFEDCISLPQIAFRLGQAPEKTMKDRVIRNTEGVEVFHVRFGGILPYKSRVLFMNVDGNVDIFGCEMLAEFPHFREMVEVAVGEHDGEGREVFLLKLTDDFIEVAAGVDDEAVLFPLRIYIGVCVE